MQSHWNIYFACSEVTCLGAFSRESNGARTHIDVKRQKRSGHWTSLVTSYGTSFDHPNLNIWPYVYTAALWTRTTYEQRCQIRNQNRNKPELSVADCILLQNVAVLFRKIFWYCTQKISRQLLTELHWMQQPGSKIDKMKMHFVSPQTIKFYLFR